MDGHYPGVDDEEEEEEEKEEGDGDRQRRPRRRHQRSTRPRFKPPFKEIFKRGDEVLVQVIKEGIGTKALPFRPTLASLDDISSLCLLSAGSV